MYASRCSTAALPARQFVGWISLVHHLRQDLPFHHIREDSGDHRFQHDRILLIFVNSLGNGPAIFVNGSDGEAAGDGVIEIDRFFKTKIHAGCQPSDLAADLGDDAGRQEAVTDFSVEFFCCRKVFIKVNRIVVPGDIGEHVHIRFREGSFYHKGVPGHEPLNGFFTNIHDTGVLFIC